MTFKYRSETDNMSLLELIDYLEMRLSTPNMLSDSTLLEAIDKVVYLSNELPYDKSKELLYLLMGLNNYINLHKQIELLFNISGMNPKHVFDRGFDSYFPVDNSGVKEPLRITTGIKNIYVLNEFN